MCREWLIMLGSWVDSGFCSFLVVKFMATSRVAAVSCCPMVTLLTMVGTWRMVAAPIQKMLDFIAGVEMVQSWLKFMMFGTAPNFFRKKQQRKCQRWGTDEEAMLQGCWGRSPTSKVAKWAPEAALVRHAIAIYLRNWLRLASLMLVGDSPAFWSIPILIAQRVHMFWVFRHPRWCAQEMSGASNTSQIPGTGRGSRNLGAGEWWPWIRHLAMGQY